MAVWHFHFWILESLGSTPSHGCQNYHLAKHYTFSGASTCHPGTHTSNLLLSEPVPKANMSWPWNNLLFLLISSLWGWTLTLVYFPAMGLRSLSDMKNYPDILGPCFPWLPNSGALGFWHWMRTTTIYYLLTSKPEPHLIILIRRDFCPNQFSSSLPHITQWSVLLFFKTRDPRMSQSRTMQVLTLYFHAIP